MYEPARSFLIGILDHEKHRIGTRLSPCSRFFMTAQVFAVVLRLRLHLLPLRNAESRALLALLTGSDEVEG